MSKMALELGSGIIGRFESKSLQRQHFFSGARVYYTQ